MKKQIFKKTVILFSFILITGIISCDKNDDLISDGISGTYVGTLSSDIENKSSSDKSQKSATATISLVGEKIELHCWSENFNETIMLDMYKHNDSIMVCLTGNDFENMYGYGMGHGNMNGHMGSMGTDWMRHMNNDHQQGDEHFGGFNMQNHSFGFTFKMQRGDYHFQGTKE